MTFSLIASVAATSLYLFLLPSLVVGQFAATGKPNAVKMMNAMKAIEKETTIRLAKKKEALVERAEHVRVSVEKFTMKQELFERGSRTFGDGEVIEANADGGAQPIDPRTPTGFGDPFFRQLNVEQKVELDSIMSVHEAKEIRKENGGDLVAEISSGWKYLYGKGSLEENGKSKKFGKPFFMALMYVAPNKIIYRRCDSCIRSHQDIYYRRTNQDNIDDITEKLIEMMIGGEKYGFHRSDCGTGNTKCKIKNECGTDFTLHSTYEDAVQNINPWKFCSTRGYGKGKDMHTTTDKIGFPGYSSPTEPIRDQYNGKQQDWAFFIEDTPWEPQFGVNWLNMNGDGEGENAKNAQNTLAVSPHMIVRLVCPTCTDERYRDLYYRRIFKVPSDVDIFAILGRNFQDQKGNREGRDFSVHSSYADALNAENAWYCGDEEGVTLAPTPLAIAGATGTVVYQAENYSDASNKVKIVTRKNKEYTGEGYVDIEGIDGYVEWDNVDGGEGGDCTIRFRYAVGGYHQERPCKVSINGNIASGAEQGILSFKTNNDWNIYTYDILETSCLQGIQTIRLTCADKRGPHIDSFKVFPTVAPVPPAPPPIVKVDFSSSSDNVKYALYGGAEIVTGAPNDVPRALRITRSKSYAKIPGIDISPSKMLDCTLSIGVYVVTIANNRGWIFGHEVSGYDRTILMHDSRFGSKPSLAVGRPWNAWGDNDVEFVGKWIHITGIFREGGDCFIYIDGIKSPFSVIGKNSGGSSDLFVGSPNNGGHQTDSWIKEVQVFDKAIGDDQVQQLSDAFHASISVPPAPSPSESGSEDYDGNPMRKLVAGGSDSIDCKKQCCYPENNGDSTNDYMLGICENKGCHYEMTNGGKAYCSGENYYNTCINNNCESGSPAAGGGDSGLYDIGESEKWRIWTRDTSIWDVKDLAFYENANCEGAEFNTGTSISSGYADSHEPGNAFDTSEASLWGGRGDTSGNLWVGMEFQSLKEIHCVSFLDGTNNGATDFRIQAWEGSSNSWKTVKRSNHQPGHRQDIVLAVEAGSDDSVLYDIVTAEKWRIWTKDLPGVWDVSDLSFYGNANCAGAEFDTGTPISSGYGQNGAFGPENAFDTSETSVWGGRWDVNRHFWIGMDYHSLKEVRCISFLDKAKNGATEFRIQAWEGNSWKTVKISNHQPGSRQDTVLEITPEQQQEHQQQVKDSDEIGFPGRCRPHINDPVNTFEGQWIKAREGKLQAPGSGNTNTWAFYIEGKSTPETGEWMSENDEMEAYLNPGAVLDNDEERTCKESAISIVEDYSIVAEDKKCPFDDSRVLRIEGKTLGECYEECYNNAACNVFSLSNTGVCMGCPDATKLDGMEGTITYVIPNVQDEFSLTLMPYKYQRPRLQDRYTGYYDIQRCGQCNDFCSWVGPSGDGSGANPESKPYTQTDHFSCKLAGGYNRPYGMTEKGYFGNSFPYQKCRREGDKTLKRRKEKYIGCFNDKSNDRALPVRIGQGSAVLTIDECADACRAKGYHYFSRQDRGYCYCGGQTALSNRYAIHGEIDLLSPEFTCSSCDEPNIGSLKQCVYQIIDQYDPDVERKKHECSHIPSINVRRHCYVSCRDQNKNYKDLLACQTLKVKGLKYLNNEIASWKDSPICDTKNCIKENHPLGPDVSQDSGIH